METTVLYKKLAQHLDGLPGGFPPTERGVERQILELLFSSKEAALARCLTLISEPAATIAFRSGLALEETETRLETMAAKGLIFRSKQPDKPPVYMAAQFVVGIWELQVGRLTPELVTLMNDYMPDLMDPTIWKKSPQMRTIPVGRSIDTTLEVMTYERAEALVKAKRHFVVAPCICRKEQQMQAEGCDKPLDVCLSFGDDEDFYIKNNIGRRVSLTEVLDILKQADRAGLVLQPSNGREISWLCCCCGCCCGILRTLKTYPTPGELVSSAFQATATPRLCTGCGICEKRCPMDAIQINDNRAILDPGRCIGCGLCVSTCPTKALSLTRKPTRLQPHVPKDIISASLKLMWQRGKVGPANVFSLFGRPFMDRYRSKHPGNRRD
ncbi:MAG: 4Fe-4S binding protein [Desulfobacterium sp.]|nr:4Fe-4S binding protein [Desulfobacterium sp.]